MNICFNNEITVQKELNSLDRFTLDFISILDKLKIKYVLVSGYVTILFGRNRASEDIDIIIEKISQDIFDNLWNELSLKYECINAGNPSIALSDYLKSNLSIRFANKGEVIPNMKIKFPKTEVDDWTLKNRKIVLLNGRIVFISPLELQIPFKLYLGSEKDIEDAKYLYTISEGKIDVQMLKGFIIKLNKEQEAKVYLGVECETS